MLSEAAWGGVSVFAEDIVGGDTVMFPRERRRRRVHSVRREQIVGCRPMVLCTLEIEPPAARPLIIQVASRESSHPAPSHPKPLRGKAMGMDIGVHTTEFGPYERPHPWGDRPDDLPLSAAVWDKAKPPQVVNSTFVIKALNEAVKQLEADAAKRP